MTVAEEAAAWMRRESQRLRDALASASLAPAPAGATLHDGGQPAEGASEDLTDEQFRELVDSFFAGER